MPVSVADVTHTDKKRKKKEREKSQFRRRKGEATNAIATDCNVTRRKAKSFGSDLAYLYTIYAWLTERRKGQYAAQVRGRLSDRRTWFSAEGTTV